MFPGGKKNEIKNDLIVRNQLNMEKYVYTYTKISIKFDLIEINKEILCRIFYVQYNSNLKFEKTAKVFFCLLKFENNHGSADEMI